MQNHKLTCDNLDLQLQHWQEETNKSVNIKFILSLHNTPWKTHPMIPLYIEKKSLDAFINASL